MLLILLMILCLVSCMNSTNINTHFKQLQQTTNKLSQSNIKILQLDNLYMLCGYSQNKSQIIQFIFKHTSNHTTPIIIDKTYSHKPLLKSSVKTALHDSIEHAKIRSLLFLDPHINSSNTVLIVYDNILYVLAKVNTPQEKQTIIDTLMYTVGIERIEYHIHVLQ